MTKTILILTALLGVACGGEPFSVAEFEAIGGEFAEAGTDGAGAPAAGRAGAAQGGSTGAGGSSSGGAGKPATGGAAAGSSSSAGSATGGAVATCDLDESKLTAALPKTLVWQDFMYTNGEFCVTCRDTPCDTVNVISWGVPTAGENENEYYYAPNADAPMVSVELGVNDGACTSEKSCGVKLYLSTLKVTVERSDIGWVVASATMSAQGATNACLDTYPSGSNTAYASGADFSKEAVADVQGLQIPCN